MAAVVQQKPIIDIKFGSINIDGMSPKSTFLLDKYCDEKRFDVLAVQESGKKDIDKITLSNMDVITDDNSAANRGVLLYIRNEHSITKLKEINKLSKAIDSTWGIAVIHNKRFIIGSVYLKHQYLKGVQELISMLSKAHDLKPKLKASGIIVIGDLNARHTLWGDKIKDPYGKKLTELLDTSKFSVCSANSPTFLCVNGSSCIDLMIVSNNLLENLETCVTDEEVYLGSGAPDRGHVPLISTFKIEGNSKTRAAIEKINTDKICWEKWTHELDHKLEQTNITSEILENPKTLGNLIDEAIEFITLKYGTKKSSSSHSKPYWTTELTRLCNIMKNARNKYRKRNTNINKENYRSSKETFDDARKEECHNFLLQKTSRLNSAQSLRFWKEFNLIFKKKKGQKIDPLFDKEGTLLTEEEDIEELLFETFFEGHHLHDGEFDDHFYNETNKIYENIMNTQNANNEYQNYEDINAKITIREIKSAIKIINQLVRVQIKTTSIQ